MQDKNGKRATTPVDIAKVHADFLHYKFSLGSFNSTGVDAVPEGPVTDNLLVTSSPTIEEVTAAVKSAKSNKAADDDRITAELLRAGGAAMIVLLVMLLSTIWAGLSTPARWL